MNNAVEVTLCGLDDDATQLKKELIVFTLLSMLISWPLVLVVLRQTGFAYQASDGATLNKLFGNIPLMYGCGPMLAAIAVTGFYRGMEGLVAMSMSVLKWRIPVRWYVWALVLPLLPQWIGLFIWATLSATPLTLPPFTSYLTSWLQIALISAAYYVTEELGWRGFMLPRFLRLTGWIKSSLILGLVWSVWHCPLWVLSNVMTTGSLPTAIAMVAAATVFATAFSVLVTWIFKGSNGSVLLAMVLHGASQANLTKMFAAAGSASLSDPGFHIIQAATLSSAALLLVLAVRFGIPKKCTG